MTSGATTGFTHSLLFAALLASIVMFVGFRRVASGLTRLPMWVYFFLASASHGFLDARPTAVWAWPSSPRSTITVFSFPGPLFECRRSALDGFLQAEVLRFSKVSSDGLGYPPRY